MTVHGAPHSSVSNYGTPSKLRQRIAATGEPAYIIAAEARVQPSRLGQYLNLRRPITHVHVLRLCEALDCSPEDILNEPEDYADEKY